MKKIAYFLTTLCMLFGAQTIMAADSSWEAEEDITSEIQQELRLAEADMEEDEDLFMDGEDEEVGDWADDETDEVAEEPAPAPAPVAEEKPAPAPAPVAKKPAPAPKPVAKKPAPKPMKKSKKRVPASFKQGFKVTGTSCNLYSKPNMGSGVILTTGPGKKLWLESENANFYKGYHKSGHGYFPADCFK